MDRRRALRGLLWVAGTVGLVFGAPAGVSGGFHTHTVRVDCARGHSINAALRAGFDWRGVVVEIRGACTENVVVTRDDVTLRGGGTDASLSAVDATADAVRVEGARRVVLEHLEVTGGRRGVVVTRGASADLRHMRIHGHAENGIVVSYGSSSDVDGSVVSGNGREGVVAANGAQVAITNGEVRGNGSHGIVAIRGAHVRVGQPLSGLGAHPVVVADNIGIGIAVTEGASGIVVSTTVQDNRAGGIYVLRNSSALIGTGASAVIAGNLVQRNGGTGINVFQGSQATVHGNVVTGHGVGVRFDAGSGTLTANHVHRNASDGIQVENASGVKIGLADSTTLAGGNTIEANGRDGLLLANTAAAAVMSNHITANGRRGIMAINGSALRLWGGNRIVDNRETGVFLLASPLLSMPFTPATTPDAIEANGGAGILAEENVSVTLQGTSIVNNATVGVLLQSGSRLQPLGGIIAGNRSGGIFLQAASSVDFHAPPTTVSGNIQFDLFCDDVESSVRGNVSGVAGGPGNCSTF